MGLMTIDQALALLAAVATVLGALTGVIIQLRRLRAELKGQTIQLLAEARLAARREGELMGRDWAQKVAPDAEPSGATQQDARPPSSPAGQG